MDCRPRWKTSRDAAVALLLGAGAPAAGPAEPTAPAAVDCPRRLELYASQPYATARGVRRRCSLLHDIARGNALETEPLRGRILSELSNRFAVELEFDGIVDLPTPAVDYMMKNMPEAAVLVSAYSGGGYMATQVDGPPGPKRFFVTNGDTFAAGLTYLFARTARDASDYMFFETGRARVLLWKIWGSSFVRYKLTREGERASRYDITVHVFTDSRLLRIVLETALFRYFARSMFEGILADIESAVAEFSADASPRRGLPPYFVAGLRRSLVPDADGPRKAGPAGGSLSGRSAL